MTSAIVYETIDAAYPVAGVDNDTQGFRDNFSIIQTGLQTAKTELVTEAQKFENELNAIRRLKTENNLKEVA